MGLPGTRRTWRWLFTAASVAWAAAIVATTFVASRPGRSTAASALIVLVYSVGRFICHQRPERSFAMWSTVMPVCARCTGIYIGAAGGAIALAFRRRPLRAGRGALLAAALPMAATLGYEWTTGVTPSNALRAVTGVILGCVVGAVIIRSASEASESPANDEVN